MRLHGRFGPIRTGDIDIDSALERWRVALELLAGSTWDGSGGVASHTHEEYLTAGDLEDALEVATDDLVALEGRAGGQHVRGGTGSGEDLVLQSTSHATRGTVSVVDDLSLSGRLIGSVSTPATITSDQDDFDPGTKGVLRLATDADWTISGFSGGASAQFLSVVNVGSFGLVLAHEGAGSVAGNRIITGPAGTDLTIPADGAANLWYDSASQRWRVISVLV